MQFEVFGGYHFAHAQTNANGIGWNWGPAWLNEEYYVQKIQPRLSAVKVREIAEGRVAHTTQGVPHSIAFCAIEWGCDAADISTSPINQKARSTSGAFH